MIVTNPIREVAHYGSAALYHDLPTPDQIRAGVLPLDSLPAAWWNGMWCDTNEAVNEARSAVGTLVAEINNAITRAGCTPDPSICDQLYQSIEKIRQTIGNAIYAGAVKSSSTNGQVSIDNSGVMTVNGVGNANYLTTTSHTVVTALNEIKSTYGNCFDNVYGCAGGVNNSRAPNNHVSSALTYGVGSASNYGHLKISDAMGQASDVAASQSSVYDLYTVINGMGGGLVCCTKRIWVEPTANISENRDYWRTNYPYYGSIITGGTTTGYKTLVASPSLNVTCVDTQNIKIRNCHSCLMDALLCSSNPLCDIYIWCGCSGAYDLGKWGYNLRLMFCGLGLSNVCDIYLNMYGTRSCLYACIYGNNYNKYTQLCIKASSSQNSQNTRAFLAFPVGDYNYINCLDSTGRWRCCCIQYLRDANISLPLCTHQRAYAPYISGRCIRCDYIENRKGPYIFTLNRMCSHCINCICYKPGYMWCVGRGDIQYACISSTFQLTSLIAGSTYSNFNIRRSSYPYDLWIYYQCYCGLCCRLNNYTVCDFLFGKIIHTPTTTGRA